MTVFLAVLKVIGITLLVILGIAIILLLIILFVPFRYKVKALSDTEKEYYDVKVDITWFLYLLHGIAVFLKTKEKKDDEGFHYEIRLFGKKIRPKDEDEEYGNDSYGSDAYEYQPYEKQSWPEDETLENSVTEADTPEDHDAGADISVTEESAVEEAGAGYNGDPEESPKNSGFTDDTTSPPDPFDEEIPDKFTDRLKQFTSFLKSIRRKAKSIKDGAGCKFRGFCDRIQELRVKIRRMKRLYEDESTAAALDLLWKELKKLIKEMRIRKYSVDLLYGFGDPALTGEVTGVLSCIFMSGGKKVMLRPDFDRTVFNGDIFFKGRLSVFTVLTVLWKLYFDKDFRRFWREIRS